MVLRVGKHLLPLCTVGVEVRVGSVETCPMVAVDDAVVICRGIIVAQTHAALVTSGDVPPLGVIVALRFTHVIGHPRGDVVV